jgi:transposase
MRQKSGPSRLPAESVVKDTRRRTRKLHSAEEKIPIDLQGPVELLAEFAVAIGR